MMLRRSVFLQIGQFDEEYRNGIEDVDLCARLFDKGYWMTVNPASRIIHHTSQTEGRHTHEQKNYEHFLQHSVKLLVPDWHFHCKNTSYQPLTADD